MRYREFNPKLFEFVTPTTGQTDLVGPLEQILKDTTADDPIHQQALDILQLIIQAGNSSDSVKTFDKQPVAQPAQASPAVPAPGAAPAPVNRHPEVRNVIGKDPNQPLSEKVATAVQPSTDVSVMPPVEKQAIARAKVAEKNILPDDVEQLKALIYKLQAEKEKAEATGREQGIKQGETQAIQQQAGFENALSTKVNRLIDKVFDQLEVLPTDKELAGKKIEPTAKELAAQKAKDSNQTRKSATRIVKGIMSDLGMGEVDPAKRKEQQQNVLNFLDKLFVGIIDMEALLMTPRANLDAYVDKEDPIMVGFYHEIVDELIGSAPITTAGAWGPGELALAVLGKPASKSQDKGDVQVGVHKIEVKSAKDAGAGGRIGGSGVNNGGSMGPAYLKLIKEYIPGIFGEDISLNKSDDNYMFTYNFVKADGKPGQKKTELSGVNQNWFNSFNQRVEERGGVDPEVVKQFMLELVKLGIKEDYHGLIEQGAVSNSVADDGTINYPKLWKAYALSAFKAYQVADQVSTIMMLNSESRSYTLFKNSKQLSELMSKKIIKANSTMMAFKGQTSLGPQMGIN